MQIEKDKVVTFHYTVSEVDGDELENSYDHIPLVYLHGHNGMLPGIEEALAGKSEGDKVSVTLEQPYGPRNDNAVQRVSINHILRRGKAKPKLKPGMIVDVNTKDGARPVVVVKVGLKAVDVDTNHPYAGLDLVYDMEVVMVRNAEPEELDHGHVHGEGGVQH